MKLGRLTASFYHLALLQLTLKGHCAVSERKSKIKLRILIFLNDAMTLTQKCLFSKSGCSQWKIRSPEHCLKPERWQGPPHVNKFKQQQTLFGRFVYSAYSVMTTERRICCLGVNQPSAPLRFPNKMYLTSLCSPLA